MPLPRRRPTFFVVAGAFVAECHSPLCFFALTLTSLQAPAPFLDFPACPVARSPSILTLEFEYAEHLFQLGLDPDEPLVRGALYKMYKFKGCHSAALMFVLTFTRSSQCSHISSLVTTRGFR